MLRRGSCLYPFNRARCHQAHTAARRRVIGRPSGCVALNVVPLAIRLRRSLLRVQKLGGPPATETLLTLLDQEARCAA
ncbi:hypothetical protein ACQCSU_16405 [Pseudarthrobacter sp. O4]|uniref:hypothetical protein n=1 Tax=Pseudarthrobacter sp. O4 TaxID=3418417 RepID=UPI003CEF2C88